MKNLLYDFNGHANSETLVQPAFQRFKLFKFVSFREHITKGGIVHIICGR